MQRPFLLLDASSLYQIQKNPHPCHLDTGKFRSNEACSISSLLMALL
jgi:hypothetical protein